MYKQIDGTKKKEKIRKKKETPERDRGKKSPFSKWIK